MKNAIKTYELYPSLNPFKVSDLLKAHGVMMQALTGDAGRFRAGGVGMFSEKGCVHMAPPADRVPMLINDLFEWLAESTDHLLIRSCVFHYEFEFIHPFSDGNGRMGRLWQSLILGKLHPLFEHLPVENMVYVNQQAYYDAITESSRIANSGPFIDFMLNEILSALKVHQAEDTENGGLNVGINERNILTLIANSPTVTVREMADMLGFSLRQCERLIAEMKRKNLIKRTGSKKSGIWQVVYNQTKEV